MHGGSVEVLGWIIGSCPEVQSETTTYDFQLKT